MPKIMLEITKEDILNADRNGIVRNPTALALHRIYPDAIGFSVAFASAKVYTKTSVYICIFNEKHTQFNAHCVRLSEETLNNIRNNENMKSVLVEIEVTGPMDMRGERPPIACLLETEKHWNSMSYKRVSK